MTPWYTIRNRRDAFEAHYFPHKEAQDFLDLPMEEYASQLARLGHTALNRRRNAAHLENWIRIDNALEKSKYTPLPPLRHVGDSFATYRCMLSHVRRYRWPKPFTSHMNDIFFLLNTMKLTHVVDLYVGALAHTFYLKEKGFSPLGQLLILDSFGLVPHFGEFVMNYSSEEYLPAEELSRKLHQFVANTRVCLADLLSGTLRVMRGVDRNAILAETYPDIYYDPEFRASKAIGLGTVKENDRMD